MMFSTFHFQFSRSVFSYSLWPHGLQHTRLPCASPTPGTCSTQVHRVSDTIQPSHPLLSPSPPAFNLSSIRVSSNESALCIRWPKYWNFSFSISPSNEYSPTPQFKNINSSVLSFLYGTILTSIHDYWKNHSFD